MAEVIIGTFSLDDLRTTISLLLDEKLTNALAGVIPNNASVSDTYLSRKEVSNLLKISLPTLHSLTLEGLVKGYRIGRRVLYKQSEVEVGLKEIAANKYKRKDLVNKLG